MSREREELEHPLAVKVAAGALGAAPGFAGPDAAVAGAGLAPVIEDVLGRIFGALAGRRAERMTQTLTNAARSLPAVRRLSRLSA
jgi:hypothetical protein